MKKHLIIEIGTNSIKALLSEIQYNKYKAISDDVYPVRLGEGINQSGRISEPAKERNLRALEQIISGVEDMEHTEISIIATESLRKAGNADDFIIEVQARTNLPVSIISGETEARLSFLAATYERDTENQQIGVLDIGGGSTELAIGKGSKLLWQKSLPIGAVKQTEQFIKHDPPACEEISNMEEHIKQKVSEYHNPNDIDYLIGVGGTITTLALLSASKSNQSSINNTEVDGMKLSIEDIQRLQAFFREKPLSGMQDIKGMPKGRADIIMAGTIILQAVMQYLAVTEVTVSIRGVRYGYLYSL